MPGGHGFSRPNLAVGTFLARPTSKGTEQSLSDDAPLAGSAVSARRPAESACAEVAAARSVRVAHDAPTGPADAELITRSLAGDSGAFGVLVVRYQDRLFGSLARLLGSEEDARDAVQEAFVQAYLKLGTFRGTSAFYTWLYRVAFNQAMSHARRQRPTRSLDDERSERGREPVDGQAAPDARLQLGERATLVQRALAALSAEYREVVVLREMDDCSYEEIAEILEVPVGTVRSRLFRARLELRDRLAPIL
jgi:RNA polymerase sigma-70 factor (ECF subfamily)